MQRHVYLLTISAFLLACSTAGTDAQQSPGGPMMQRPPPQSPGGSTARQPSGPPAARQQQEMQERQTQRRDEVEDENDRDWRPGWRYHHGWGRGAMGPGMTGFGGPAGPGGPGPVAMRIIFSLMDVNGDGTVSLDEFKAAHERIFRAMDANKDGALSLDEIQAFIRGARQSNPQR